MSEQVRALWGDRVLPWHSLGEAYPHGSWLKRDATIPSAMARAKGRPYDREFDGEHDIYSVEGPVVKELGSRSAPPGRDRRGALAWSCLRRGAAAVPPLIPGR